MGILSDKRVAVIGDNDLLCKAIKHALHGRLRIELPNLGACDRAPSPGEETPHWDLIIVAIASEDSEAIAELAAAKLIGCVGRVPVMIVSPRPFETPEESGISHFCFPFAPDLLCQRVRSLLLDHRLPPGA